MNAITAHSTSESVEQAVADVKKQFGAMTPVMVVFFASPKYDPALLSRKMKDAFPAAAVFGSTTAGEIVSGKMLKRSLVAMALSAGAVSDVDVQVVTGLKSQNRVKDAFAGFEKHFGVKMSEVDHKKYVGIILIDGLSGAEEKIIDTIGDLSNATFIGGSAGDDLQFKATHVFANGQAHTDACVLALLKPAVGFDVLKIQSFRPCDKKLTATKVNEAKRTVIEFNDVPAAEAYAEALGVKVEDSANSFMHHPVGLMVKGEPYVRSPQQIKGGEMVFYCNVKQGTELTLLESTDIVADTRKALDDKLKQLGPVQCLINFHCILRTLELDQKSQSDAYGKLFSRVPTVGFSTYGEQYIGHVNQTSTILILK